MANPDTTKFGPDILMSDHLRKCQGREYQCSCGYDDAKDDEIKRLRSELEAAKADVVMFIEKESSANV